MNPKKIHLFFNGAQMDNFPCCNCTIRVKIFITFDIISPSKKTYENGFFR